MADLTDWLVGGDAARRELLEGDTHLPAQQAEPLGPQQVDAAQQATLRRMHELLAAKLGQEFPGQRCQICGKGRIFERLAMRKAYSLTCPNRCTDTLILPEEMLLKSLRKLPMPQP